LKVILTALNATYGHTNLAIRYLKNYCVSDNLIENSMQIICKEFTINDFKFNTLEELVNENAKVYAFSCYIWNIRQVLEIADDIKKIIPDSVVVLGGPEVSYEVDRLLQENNYIDYIVKGQGEEAFRKILLHIFDEIRYKTEFDFSIDKTRVLDFPYEKFQESDFPYKTEKISNTDKQYYYESSRGCPFSCSYCLSSVEKQVVFLNIDRVKKDLKFFVDSGIKQVKLVDRTFNADVKRANIIWNYLIDIFKKKPYDTNFHFEISADILTDESLEILSKAPEKIFRFEIGIQSTNENVLKNVNRKSDLVKLFSNISKILENKNIEVHLDLIAGLPGESFDIFKKSFNDVYTLNPDMIQLGFLKMIRGSKIRKQAKSNGTVFSSYPPYEILATKDISFCELMKLRRIEYLLEKYYNSKQFKYSQDYVVKTIGQQGFEFFERFYLHFDKNVTFSRKLSRKSLISVYFEFCQSLLNGKDKFIFADLLKFDYYCFDNKGGIDNIDFNYSDNHPEFQDSKKNPDWFDENGRWKIKKPRMEKYCFDPVKLIEDGIIESCKAFVLYDLSGNKPVIIDCITYH